MPDVTVTNHGSIFTFRPLTPAAHCWLEDNVSDDAPWWGGALAVEPRYAHALVEGLEAEGLVIG